MINKSELRVGDRVGHPAWGTTTYECTSIEPDRFFVQVNTTTVDFPFSNSSFFIAEKKVKTIRKSGFAKFIKRVEHG